MRSAGSKPAAGSYTLGASALGMAVLAAGLTLVTGACIPGRHCHSTLSMTVIGYHSVGICTVILLALLSFSVKMTVSPMARRVGVRGAGEREGAAAHGRESGGLCGRFRGGVRGHGCMCRGGVVRAGRCCMYNFHGYFRHDGWMVGGMLFFRLRSA